MRFQSLSANPRLRWCRRPGLGRSRYTFDQRPLGNQHLGRWDCGGKRAGVYPSARRPGLVAWGHIPRQPDEQLRGAERTRRRRNHVRTRRGCEQQPEHILELGDEMHIQGFETVSNTRSKQHSFVVLRSVLVRCGGCVFIRVRLRRSRRPLGARRPDASFRHFPNLKRIPRRDGFAFCRRTGPYC